MYIRKIHITNIRGLEEVDLDLDRGNGQFAGWTVIAGRNATGKSTLLQAIALCLTGPTEARQLQPSFANWLRNDARKGNVEMDLVFDPIDHGQAIPGAHDSCKASLYWERNGGKEPMFSFHGPSRVDGFTEKQELLGPWSWDAEGWFWCGYGPGRRIGRASANSDRSGSPKLERVITLFDEERSLHEAIDWLRELYSDRLDLAERERHELMEVNKLMLREKTDRLLKLEQSVLALLNDGLLPEGAGVAGFNREGLWIEQNGATFSIHQLSDGYRSVVALVFDIVRHMYECYGGFGVVPEPCDHGDIVAVPYEGVVLIDEVEAHLHVEWQQRIGFWLKQHFPNVQFIVTTHSPFICQAADKKGLIQLSSSGSGIVAKHVSDEDYLTIVNGGADEAAMTVLFGLEHPHSEASEKLRTEVAELEVSVIRGRATEEGKARLQRLAAELPSTGSALVEQAVRKLEALDEKA